MTPFAFRMRISLALAGCLLLLATGAVSTVSLAAPATPVEPILYTLRFPAPQTHYVEVEAIVPTAGAATLDLMMPVWTPGSYLVREYERNVEALGAKAPDGRALPVEKTRKNHWRVATAGVARVTLSYRVYGREMTVRNDWIEDGFAILNGAPTFITSMDALRRPHEVRLVLPSSWHTSVTPLPPATDGAPHHYVAPDYDTLVDSPIIAGNPSIHPFDVEGTRHFLVNVGDDSAWDAARAVGDLTTLVRERRRMWGLLPYPAYYFLNAIVESGSGLEHKNAAMLMTSRWQTRTRKDYLAWLALASHEYFHAWNVKRLRPVELGPFDYDRENYTRCLWEAEGFTEYYGNLDLVRAGLATREEYLQALSEEIATLRSTPGRHVTPLAQTSFDAWIKEYRPDENTNNTTVSYYTRGSQAAFLLDAKIRRATSGARSLDDVMRAAYQRYSGARGFTEAEFVQTASEVAGVDLRPWFVAILDGTEDPDYQDALAWYGLRLATPAPPSLDGHRRAWTGMGTRSDGSRLFVADLVRGTPAYDSGLAVDDEIVAIDEVRVAGGRGRLDARLERYRPGDRVTFTVSRRERLLRYPVTLGEEPGSPWGFAIDPAATESQRAHLAAWLGSR